MSRIRSRIIQHDEQAITIVQPSLGALVLIEPSDQSLRVLPGELKGPNKSQWKDAGLVVELDVLDVEVY